MENNGKENLYDYVFWYNHYDSLWYAISRDTLIDFFGGNKDKSRFLKSKQHSTLVEIICKNLEKRIKTHE